MLERNAIVPVTTQSLSNDYFGQGGSALQNYVAPSPQPQAPVPPTVTSAPPPSEVVISVADIIRYIRVYGRWGFALALPIAAAVLYFLGFGPKIYESESKLKIDIENAGVIVFGQQTGAHLSELSTPMIINNHRTQLKTRKFTDYLFSKLTEEEREHFLAGLGQLGTRAKMMIALGISSPPRATAVGDLFANLTDLIVRVEPLKDSHIIRIIVRDGTPEMAAALANHYVKDYIDYMSSEANSGKQENAIYLQQKSNELRDKLEVAQKKLAKYRQDSDVMKAGANGEEVNSERADALAKAVSEAEVALIRAENDVELLHRLQAGGLEITQVKAVADDLRLNNLRKEADKAESERLALAEICGAKHPKIIALNNTIAEKLAKQTGRVSEIVMTAESEESRLRRQFEELQSQLKAARGEAIAEGSKRSEYALLNDEVTSNRELYNQVQLKLKQEGLNGGSAGLGVADIAVSPSSPVSPVKSIALIASMMVFGIVGLGLPVTLGLSRDHLLPLLRSSSQPTAPAPTGNAVPPAPYSPPAPPPQTQGLAGFATIATLRPGIAHSQTQVLAKVPELQSVDGASQLRELLTPTARGQNQAITQLVTTLSCQSMTRRGPGIVLITSATASEGKSLIASGLAAALCTSGQEVFLMECNPASPCIQNWYPQVVNCSSNSQDFESLRYGQSSLYILPAFDLPSYSMSDLIDGYRAWLSRAWPRVDWIILDGASLLRGFADVAQLASLATDILFVHDDTRSTPEQVRAAINLLKPLVASETMRGLVLNRSRE